MEKRVHHVASKGVATEIPDMISWLLLDSSFQARQHACRVLKLFVLITGRPRVNYLAVTFELSGSKLAPRVFASGAELCLESRWSDDEDPDV